MPEILPPQFAGVQQRPFYVKARSVITAVSVVWLVLAVAGYGSFSGGTTSLALSLALMYGTGVAILVVASALYRLVKRSAVRRTENAPQDHAAAVFVDATRFAAEELKFALAPSWSGSRPASAWPAAVPATAGLDSAAQQESAPAAHKPLSKPDVSRPAAKAAPVQAKTVKPGVSQQDGKAASVEAKANKPAAGRPQAGHPTVSKSVVNKKAAAKKKKGSKPRQIKPGTGVHHQRPAKQAESGLKRAA
ncbi:hypothetical protein [Arthrobacter sp. Edens01]|uniref:hypothetical protein n=1 Tax=Arthrobacter sp. Edens01 TaxID=1732020 RepID=UPI000A4E972A|nr:hypothetical protein [Arthrobacter sp. Edens01]